jgi:hypothetical protein
MMNGNMQYKAFNCSCIGASHLKNNKPCQDYSAHYRDANFILAVVADGHGSDSHFRSDRGARFACEAAVECAKAENPARWLKDEAADDDDLTLFYYWMKLRLIPDLIAGIICRWNEKVSKDWNGDTPVANKENKSCFEFPPSVYGTTLIAAVVTRRFWFGFQIGDGKCVAFDDDGYAMEPIPWDDNCFLNVTTSLCEKDAMRHFRFFSDTSIPRAIFISTDGVDDSYPVYENEKHLASLYGIILDNFAKEGFENGVKELQDFLPRLTQKGSGDDVSIAGIIREG